MSTESAREYAKDLAASLAEQAQVNDFDAYEWLEGLLDYRRVVDSSDETIELQLLVACGGPNAWLDVWPTSDGYAMQVRASWYSDEVTVRCTDDVSDMAWALWEAMVPE